MKRKRRAGSPRAALAGALLFILLGTGLYAVSPAILPVRILEGPLVQQAREDGATLVWYTTRPLEPGEAVLILEDGPVEHRFPVEPSARRNVVQITGLAAAGQYPYRIGLGRRTLAQATLHTAKPPGEPLSFIVFGDSGRGTIEQYRLAAQMRAPGMQPDFLLHTGDLVYGSGERSDFKDRFFAPYRAVIAEVCFWPALGNHDIATDDGQPYLDVFELPENGPPALPPERNYWFDYASARVVVIDSNPDESTLATHVAPWVREVFSGCDATWKFVSLHHPPYTGGAYRPDVGIQRALVPAFEETGVDVVFCGHDHMYQRTYSLRGGQIVPDGAGVVYVVTGAGGGRLYDPLPPERQPPYIAAIYSARHSFTHVELSGLTLRLQQIDINGRVVDEWSFTKDTLPATQPATQEPDAGPDPPAPPERSP